jgi:tRNA/tmRNA/rRNA uracil-C5-methylase (TrmA/RlmC/RlmD family)
MTAPAAPPIAVGVTLELDVGEPAHGGWCVCRYPGGDGPGSVVFVRHALPGERVLAVVTQATARFARADAVEIRTGSADRVQPPCPHARPGGCGGCDWQHASLPAQRQIKEHVIGQQLRRIAGLDRKVRVEPLPGDVGGLRWRTSARFAVRPDGNAGLRRHRSHEIVPVGDCPLAHPLVGSTGVLQLPFPGARSAEVAVEPRSGERAVLLAGHVTGGAADRLSAEAVLLAGRRGAAPVRGRGYLTRHAAGRDWRVAAGGFWQVHPGAADTLAAAVLAALEPEPGDEVLDLYCGAGLFAGVLAAAVGPAGRVTGFEHDRAAVRDARHNLRDVSWARVHHGDVASLLRARGLSGAGLAVADPPRTGLGRAVVDLLSGSGGPSGSTEAVGLRRIAYVSCDPATLARDIRAFLDHGWELAGLRAFDAFPMTHHVECLATLTRGQAAGRPGEARRPS